MSVEGTIIGRGAERVVRVNEFDIEVAPSSHMVFFNYVDRPGIIGAVGTALGAHGINIATMDVGRKGADGQMEALMCLTVDTIVPSEVLDDIATQIEAKQLRAFSLPA